MSLETLKGIKNIGGFRIFHGGSWPLHATTPIGINYEDNIISFKLQNGPKHGVEGCQVDTIIDAVAYIITGLNHKLKDPHNNECIHHLQRAVRSLEKIKTKREIRGVEGTSQA